MDAAALCPEAIACTIVAELPVTSPPAKTPGIAVAPVTLSAASSPRSVLSQGSAYERSAA